MEKPSSLTGISLFSGSPAKSETYINAEAAKCECVTKLLARISQLLKKKAAYG